jgi:DNA polymerase-1
MIRAFGERVARNAPIQGTAADVIKLAMVKVFNRLEKEVPTAKLILQVHDELIVECLEQDAQLVCDILKFEMENATKMAVTLTADAAFGKTWLGSKL